MGGIYDRGGIIMNDQIKEILVWTSLGIVGLLVIVLSATIANQILMLIEMYKNGLN